MKVVFFGTDNFSKNVLEFLLEKSIDVVAVVTRPDKQQGRGRSLLPSVVKKFLQTIDFKNPIYQPARASTEEFESVLKNLNPDLFIVVSYGQIIKQNILDLPRYTSINVHASILPKYRGASPMQSVIINGEKKTGVTIMEMALEMDAGDIIKIGEVEIPEDMNYGELSYSLCDLAKSLLLSTIFDIENNNLQKHSQNHSQATFTKKITVESSFIDWNKPASEIHNLVRGMNPRPGARCFVEIRNNKKILKILKTQVVSVENSDARVGEIVFFDKTNGFVIACNNSFLKILEVQIEGKKAMKDFDFINGFLCPVIV